MKNYSFIDTLPPIQRVLFFITLPFFWVGLSLFALVVGVIVFMKDIFRRW